MATNRNSIYVVSKIELIHDANNYVVSLVHQVNQSRLVSPESINRIVFCFFTVRVIEYNTLFCLIHMSFKYQYKLYEIVYNATFPLEWM